MCARRQCAECYAPTPNPSCGTSSCGSGLFALFFALMGLAQGVNPGVNRPMVMAITPPELRGAAFAVYITVFEAVAWAAFSLGAGFLGDAIGLRVVFLWVLVVLMAVNGAVLTLLYRTYAKDVTRVQQDLDRRRTEALTEGATHREP
ncbi:MFS transporter [Streptomyces sp. NPDC056527]|uniref:MFS transporter n=1 Tax=Streptomyces sp. NPDC056527 TaxID=3345853 RepID=UPI003685D650